MLGITTFIFHTCAFPTVTSQNVFGEKAYGFANFYCTHYLCDGIDFRQIVTHLLMNTFAIFR